MTTLTVTAKGQITLKRELLRHLGVGPGDQVEVDLLPHGGAVLTVSRPGSWDAFCGRLACDDAQPVTIEQMNEAIATGWSGR
ncbi:MAG: AbrB/MazE/SpoVT family DNA-binding domain-containing protein [Propionibacteriaceae bacterium]|nr:AbrB/MazE/SpoVT family DNA-binding domain-containing protein [Propionibacteriaceae bacterium]